MSNKREGKTIMTFVLKDKEYLPLKINSVENGVDLSDLLHKIVSNSYEYKNHYAPIKDLKPITNARQKRKKDGFNQTNIFADKIFNQKIKVMALINNTSGAEILRHIVVKYSPKLPSLL